MTPAFTYTFDLHRQARENLLSIVQVMTPDQLNAVPANCNNNLIWNAGHVIATAELVTYGLGGHPLPSGLEFVNRYRKGTRPEGQADQREIDFIRHQLLAGHTRMVEDFQRLDWSAYRPYTTSFGSSFSSIEEAVTFNNLHEAMHLGSVLVLRRWV